MQKEIDNLLKWSFEAWATLDHNEHEGLVSELYQAIEAVKAAQHSVQRTACLGGNAHIVIKGSDVCMVCGAKFEASRR